MKKILLGFITVFATTTVFAAGGTSCEVNNDDIVIHVNLVNSRFPGVPVAQGKVTASIKEHLSTPWTFDGVTDQVGWWSTPEVINFSYYKENDEPYEIAYLVVKTNVITGTEYTVGTYEFHQNGTLVSSGSITCSFE